MKKIINYITKTFKKIIEAIKNPDMPETTLLANLKPLIEQFIQSQNFVNDVRCIFHTINGVRIVDITIDLIERKSISTRYSINNNSFYREYIIQFPHADNVVLNTSHLLDEADGFERKSINLIGDYFRSTGYFII